MARARAYLLSTRADRREKVCTHVKSSKSVRNGQGYCVISCFCAKIICIASFNVETITNGDKFCENNYHDFQSSIYE